MQNAVARSIDLQPAARSQPMCSLEPISSGLEYVMEASKEQCYRLAWHAVCGTNVLI
jgi:hypothetical protein